MPARIYRWSGPCYSGAITMKSFRILLLLLGALLLGNGLSGNAQSSVLQITNFARGENGFRLIWQGAATNTAYTLQYQDSLNKDLWRIPHQFFPFPGHTNEWTDPVDTNASRFYRLLQVTSAERGKVISNSLPTAYTVSQLRFIFALAGVTNVTVQYPVSIYRVVYETVTPLGDRTVASGALCLPEGVGAPLPLLSYQHGTVVQTNLAPSSLNLQTEVAVGIAFATGGYAAVVPDYLGLGVSPGLHPYHHARSEATACVDMLRAARTVCVSLGVALTNRLFLCGYSQGGHATMALLRELEWHHADEFVVTACAPMAGAYDLSGTTASDFLSTRIKPNPYYFLYLLAAYRDVYRLAPSLADLLTLPYSTNLPPLLNGASSGAQINALLPADPTQILKLEYLNDFRNDPRHPLRIALEDNDVYKWAPLTPLRFFHCAADGDVLQANSLVAVSYLQSFGLTNVSFEDPLPAANHGGCVQPSLLKAKDWFDSLK
jgi:hypothetical protein